MSELSCPCCGLQISSERDIEASFGYRIYPSGKKVKQSWCRRCRNHGRLDFHQSCPYKSQ